MESKTRNQLIVFFTALLALVAKEGCEEIMPLALCLYAIGVIMIIIFSLLAKGEE